MDKQENTTKTDEQGSPLMGIILGLIIAAFFAPLFIALAASPEVFQETMRNSDISVPLTTIAGSIFIVIFAKSNFDFETLQKSISGELEEPIKLKIISKIVLFAALIMIILSMFLIGIYILEIFSSMSSKGFF